MQREAFAVRLLLLISVLTMAAAMAHADVIVSLPVQTIITGSSTSVGLEVSGLGNLTAPSLGVFDIDVSFDSTVLQFTGVVFGDAMLGDQLDLFGLGSFQDSSSSGGIANVFELSFDSVDDLNNLQAAQFTLATLNFQALSAGTTDLTLSINALGDANGDALSVTKVGGFVHVKPLASVPEPTSAVLLATGVLVLTRSRQKRTQR